MQRVLALVAVLLLARVSQAGLVYSGDDLSAGTGTMTITADNGGSTSGSGVFLG